MQNRLLLNWNVSTLELEIGKWELGISILYFLFSVFYFLFSVSRFPFLLYARLQSCKLTRWKWELGIGNFCFPFSIFLTVFCRFDPRKLLDYKIRTKFFKSFWPNAFHFKQIIYGFIRSSSYNSFRKNRTDSFNRHKFFFASGV
ncbi:MAG: hypothetical protein KCCBMMGE_00431 [Candidatus Methanoperedenaceae archaeon GB37]|nr:MAG: hypothetical protein KCCBMMGE_00431 [Candidatus Methanoperedenaceae archaeon GB37]